MTRGGSCQDFDGLVAEEKSSVSRVTLAKLSLGKVRSASRKYLAKSGLFAALFQVQQGVSKSIHLKLSRLFFCSSSSS